MTEETKKVEGTEEVKETKEEPKKEEVNAPKDGLFVTIGKKVDGALAEAKRHPVRTAGKLLLAGAGLAMLKDYIDMKRGAEPEREIFSADDIPQISGRYPQIGGPAIARVAEEDKPF